MPTLFLLSAAIFCFPSFFSLPVLGLGLELAPAPPPAVTQNLTNSLHLAINAAMIEAINSLNRIKLHQSESATAGERTALSDCSEFYQLTVDHLNQTLDTSFNTTSFDVQIWLSAALTNLDNCITSMSEQNVTCPVFLQDYASKLISNGLAINAQIMRGTRTVSRHDDNLHRWFPDGDFMDPLRFKGKFDFVVAKDRSGNYGTIKEALDASKRSGGNVVIYIKKGTYNEILEITRDMKNVVLIGDGIGKTIITGNRSAQSGFSTRESGTVKVMGDGFIARDLSIRNTAGAAGGQAVAMLSSSDRSAYYRCAFEGYQDTLWVDSNRQFYRECAIYGTIDFIFGNAAAVIENSLIYARTPRHGQEVVITAQGRSEPNQPTGISIINSRFMPDPKQKKGLREFKAFLGRPWRDYARTVYMKSFLDGMVDPKGWADWSYKGDDKTKSVYYAEYGNYGPGCSTKGRVKWKGFKVITDIGEARRFGVRSLIGGHTWLPNTGVPYSAGNLDDI